MSFTLFVSSDNIDGDRNKITPLVLTKNGGHVFVSYDEANTWVKETALGVGTWKTAISATNGRIAVADGGPQGHIFVYDAQGKTWTQAVTIGGGWVTLAGSADMRQMAAVHNSGALYLSPDMGATWAMVPSISDAVDVAMSDDGSRLACVQRGYGGYIQVSYDYGATWMPRITSGGWETVTMSASGVKMVAAENSGHVYVSDDGGNMWVQRPEVGHWREVAITKDGWKMVAVKSGPASGAGIFISTDFGISWEEKVVGITPAWTSVALTPDGQKMVALAPGKFPYVSIDGGETWTPRMSATPGNWTCVALSAISEKEVFEELDDPPTLMKTSVRLPTLSRSRDTQNQRYRVYLERYFLDCIWRDSERPDLRLTANSGTSKSDKIFVTFYVGDIGQNIRLIQQSDRTRTGVDCDVILHRASELIGELSSFYEYTAAEVFDSNYWFENQYTNQHRLYAGPGFLLGPVDMQALLALRRVAYITVKLETNRTDQFRSPFWYRKFLTGVSLYDESQGKYDIVENGTQSLAFFKEVGQITLTAVGQGPYHPKSLYTFAQPLHEELFEGNLSSVWGVAASPGGTINLMGGKNVELVLQQAALAPVQNNASALESYVIPSSTKDASGKFVAHPIYAKSDFDAYEVSTADGAGAWTTTSPSLSGAGNTELLPFPNGRWRGQPLASQNTVAPNVASPFPWERELSQPQLEILNGTLAYNGAAHGTQVLPTEHYLYMPSGDWGQRVGERSLQVDFGSPQYVNKLELIFPKSQERWQPTRLNATIQRAWPTDTAATYVDQYPAIWHQGFQYRYPYGQNDGQVCKYIHTLTQRLPFNGAEGDMALGTHTGNLTSTYDVSGAVTLPVSAYNLPTIVDAPVYANAATMEVGSAKTFDASPNDLNPAFDYRRFEYGPFYQGTTRSWLQRLETASGQIGGVSVADLQVAFPVAVCPRYRQPDWIGTESPNKFFFETFRPWLESAASENVLGGILQRWFLTAYEFRLSLPFWGAPAGLFEMSASTGNAVAAFDFDDSTFWEAGGYSGSTYVPSNSVSTSSNYAGSTQTMYGTTSYANGEWLQIKAPRPILLDGFFVQPRQAPSVWQAVSVSSSINGWIDNGGVSIASNSGADDTARIVVDPSNQRFTMTTSDGMYDQANGGNYAGPASPLPSQAAFVYQPNQTPDYTHGPFPGVDGEWFAVQFDRPKRIKGYTLSTTDIRQAPRRVAVFCKNAADPYWYSRSTKTISDLSRKVDVLDDDVNGDPRGFTHWAVVIAQVKVSVFVEAPAHIFAVYDTFLGREIRANIEQRQYSTFPELTTAISSALNAETNGQVTYSLSWNSVATTFNITCIATVSSLVSAATQPTSFSILATDLALALGFSASPSPSSSFVGSPMPPIFPNGQTRATYSIKFHEAGEEDTTGYGNVAEQDQPVLVRILGSNDGHGWSSLGTRLPSARWRSRGGDYMYDMSFITVNGQRQKRTAKYQYYRFVFLATQKSTSVRVSKLAIYAHDYDSPEYAATIAGSNGAPLFPLDYTSPSDRDDIYADCYDWLLSKFSLYQIYNGQPLLDYMVKEEYYFAPNIDQTDSESVYPPFNGYRPNYKAVAQKMVNPMFAEGRYAGAAVGYESTNRGYYAGNVVAGDASADRDHKCFAWRFCHQLYDFYSTGGTISNKIRESDVEAVRKAAFHKRFQMGMLTGTGLVDGGKWYTNAKLTDPQVDLGQGTEVLVENETVRAYASSRHPVGGNVTVNGVTYLANVSVGAASTYNVAMATIASADNIDESRTKTASIKSALYRKADFTLNFQSANDE